MKAHNKKLLSVKRANTLANRFRRERAAAKQAPLPLAEQLRRADANRAAHRARYPVAPKLDPFAHVRGDPRLRDEPAPKHPTPRQLTLADLIYAFDVSGGIVQRMKSGLSVNEYRRAG